MSKQPIARRAEELIRAFKVEHGLPPDKLIGLEEEMILAEESLARVALRPGALASLHAHERQPMTDAEVARLGEELANEAQCKWHETHDPKDGGNGHGVKPLTEGRNEIPGPKSDGYTKPQTPKRTWCTSYTLAELLSADFPEPDWLCDGLLPTIGLVLITARPKKGKSTLMRQAAIAVGSNGGMFLGKPTKAGHVLYLSEENPRNVQRHLRDMGAVTGNVRFEFDWPALNQSGITKLREYCAQNHSTMIVVDTLTTHFVGARLDWNKQGEVAALLEPLHDLAYDFKCLVVGIDHISKGRDSMDVDPIDAAIGSTSKTAIADDVWALCRKRGEGTVLVGQGRNIGEPSMNLRFDPVTRCYQLAEGPRPDSLQGLILAYLKEHGQATTAELSKALDKDPAQINRELAELVAKCAIERLPMIGHCVPYGMINTPKVNLINDVNHVNLINVINPERLTIDNIDSKASINDGGDGDGQADPFPEDIFSLEERSG